MLVPVYVASLLVYVGRNFFSGSVHLEFCRLLFHGHLFFFRLGKFSSIILLKIFTVSSRWDLCSILYLLSLGLDSHCVLNFLDVLG